MYSNSAMAVHISFGVKCYRAFKISCKEKTASGKIQLWCLCDMNLSNRSASLHM